jgi:hypothetical protein
VIVDYDAVRLGPDCPFVQAAPGPSGWYAEVVSELFLPEGSWPLDREWLRGAGWLAPNDSTDNWWREHVPAQDVVACLLDGLRCARTCLLPDVVTLSTGTFPPRPRGGQPLARPASVGRFAA